MKNEFIYKFLSKVIIRVKGNHLERFIHRLSNYKIELLNIKYLDRKTVDITIYTRDYDRIMEIKSVYEIDTLDYHGIIKIKKKLRKTSILLFFMVFGFGLLIFLTNVIFSVEIIHTNKDIRSLLFKELEHYGIRPYNIKKNFDEIESIKNEIVNRNRDKIEWMEIERVGTKYVIRVEIRKLNEVPEVTPKRNVVASKSAIIKRVIAKRGQIVKNTNDYVKEGDVIISGNITLFDSVKEVVSAEGTVYGEVWYQTTVEYPFEYYEEQETGRKKNVFVLKIFNKDLGLFDFKPFKDKKKDATTYVNHLFLPISFEYQKQKEVKIINDVLDENEALLKAEELARKKMEEQLKEGEYIINQKSLKIDIKESKIVVDTFFTVYEDITSYLEIVEENIEEE